MPGLLPRDPQRETYRVSPGETLVLALEPGDRLAVHDVQGGQRALLVSEELGLAADLFGPESTAGAEETFEAVRAATVAVTAPEGVPVVEGGVPATDLEVEIRRVRARDEFEPALPEPLAEPRLDFEVARASALAYEVKAGEYIQVIDVKGRQCSDFLAFDWQELQDGLERGLDSTATRSLMGSAYPQPGLFSEVLTTRTSGAARRGRARHGRTSRHVRPRLHGEVLRRHGLLRPRQLLGQLQRASCCRTRSRPGRAGRRSTSSSTPGSTPTTCSSPTSRGRGPATTCCCAR